MHAMSGLEEWWAGGERVLLPLGGGNRVLADEREVFVRRMGAGPTITLLPGFPSSSHDWAKVAPLLAERHSLLLVDFLGFGASEKPTEHEYSLHEQADLVEALWSREGIRASAVMAHDYAVSVTQELLARDAEGSLDVELRDVTLLNGGLYPDLHRPQPTQTALLDPLQGPRISALLNEDLFVSALRPTFADAFDAGRDSAEIWQATSRDGGERVAHLLIRYISDRERHAERWVTALHTTAVPVSFVWGMLDPVSGRHMAERIRERLPRAPFLALEDVAHWPSLEAPERVARAVLDN
jgi:pimeloyl-ACP methyl ester carboxylesterase